MSRYRSIPEEVEALLFNGTYESGMEIKKWAKLDAEDPKIEIVVSATRDLEHALVIDNDVIGEMKVRGGYYVVKKDDDFFGMAPDLFRKRYIKIS